MIKSYLFLDIFSDKSLTLILKLSSDLEKYFVIVQLILDSSLSYSEYAGESNKAVLGFSVFINEDISSVAPLHKTIFSSEHLQ